MSTDLVKLDLKPEASSRYRTAFYDTLKLQPGAFASVYIPHNHDALTTAVDIWLANVRKTLARIQKQVPPLSEYRRVHALDKFARDDDCDRAREQTLSHDIIILDFCDFHEYLQVCKRDGELREDRPVIAYGTYRVERLAKMYDRRKYTPDMRGYVAYLSKVVPRELYQRLEQPLPISLPDPHKNIYVCATIGSGKSELLKVLAHQSDEALIIIDPSNDFAEQIAKFPEFSKRLVYIDPILELGYTPTINPFDIPRSFENLHEERIVKDAYTQEIVSVLEQMLQGADLTNNMNAVLKPSVRAMLDIKDATLADLELLMYGDRTIYGKCLNSTSKSSVSFFKNLFNAKSFDTSKKAIGAKLRSSFLQSDTFLDLTCGRSTINLEREIEARKVIVFNLSKGTITAPIALAFGRLVLAQVLGIAQRRGRLTMEKRTPTRCIIDEFQSFVVPSVFTCLAETRKYELRLTLCQPSPALDLSQRERVLLYQTTGVKFFGRANNDAQRETATLAGVEPADIAGLAQRGEFYMVTEGRAPVRMRISEHLLGDRHSVTDWDVVKSDQLARYYRPIMMQNASSVDAHPAHPDNATASPEDTDSRKARRQTLV